MICVMLFPLRRKVAIVSQCLTVIIDRIGLPHGHNIVVNRSHFRPGILVLDQTACRQRETTLLNDR